MRLYSNKFNNYPSRILGTVVVAVIVVTLPISAYAASSQEVAQIAKKTTVQINNVGSPSPGGSGVIIAKEGNTYTVLTANHVVCDALDRPGAIVCSSDITYSVRTSTGKEYPIKETKVLQKSKNDTDLAVVTFEATEDYPVVTLGNSDQAEIAADIFVAGFPAIFGKSGTARDFTFTKGLVVSHTSSAINGYSLIYDARTMTGNSGGPVFDVAGRLVAIHGLADTSTQSKSETGNSIPQKSGFNAGVPINTFLAMRSQISSISSIKQDNTSTGVNSSIRLSKPQSARDFYARGLTKIEQSSTRADRGAIEDFNQAIRLDPNFDEAYLQLGSAYHNRGLQGKDANSSLNAYKVAIENYSKALRINPDFFAAYLQRVKIYGEINEIFARTKTDATTINENIQAAFEDINQLLRIDPNSPYAYREQGAFRFEQKDYQGAFVSYQKAVENFERRKITGHAYDNSRTLLDFLKRYHDKLGL